MLRRARLAVICALASCGGGESNGPDPIDDSIEGQIRALFPADGLQSSALSQIAAVRQHLAAASTIQARNQAVTLVELTLTSLKEGRLAGGNGATSRAAASRLTDAIYQLVGLDPPRLTDVSLAADNVAKSVGAQGGSVVTPSGAAGAEFPAGALTQSVLVVVNKLPGPVTPGSGPLPTGLKQYPPYYEFSTFPAVPEFGDSVRVGVCQVTDPSSQFYAPEAIHPQLRIAHQKGAGVEILAPASVTDFLTCTSPVTPDVLSAEKQSRSGSQAISSKRNTFLAFAHGGLGGKTKSFSPFGAVDIASGPVSTVSVAPSAATVAQGQTRQLTATTSDASGIILSGRTVTWMSSNPGIATVTPSGAVATVTGVAAGGPVTITATSEGVNGTATITVVNPVPAIASAVRQPLGNYLADPLPPTQLPRGGRYLVLVSGSALNRVNGVSFTNPLVTATMRTITATSVTMDVSTPAVEEGESALAALGEVGFTFTASDGQTAPSGSVTLSIVEGPLPAATRLVVTNGVTRLKAGVTTVVTFEGESVDAGNTKFLFIGSQGLGNFDSQRPSFQGNSIFLFTIRFTPPDANAVQGATWGVVDGSGHKAQLQMFFPVDP